MINAATTRAALAAAICAGLTGCAVRPAEFMREPALSPVGSGLSSQFVDQTNFPTSSLPGGRRGPTNPESLYTEKRVSKVGDIITVLISINDKATFGNSLDRSKASKPATSMDWNLSTGASSSSSPPTLTTDSSATSNYTGKGTIDRSEQIQVSVAAVVSDVLPNGNLVISGSQEVRVNFELRQLTVAGIVRPSDIAKSNTIAYDHIAEARISYGGRGRASDVQQPNWGQQIYDSLAPF